MKKIYTILLAVASLVFILASCQVKETAHKPGEPDADGCYGVFFPAQEESIVLDPADPTEATIQVARTNASGAITVPYTVLGSTDIVTASEIVFADGQETTTVSLSFPNAEVGVEYTLSFQISDPQYASKYNSQPVAFDYSILRDKWNSLGMAKYIDTYLSDANHVYERELIQNENKPTLFRLLNPFDQALIDGGYVPDYVKRGPSDYLEFEILAVGSTAFGYTISQSGLVYFYPAYTGFFHPTYAAEVMYYHPGHMNSTGDPSFWSYNRVLQYQDNGLPAGIQLAPFEYMDGIGGWNQTQEDGVLTIIFPGAVLTDYTLSIKAGQSNKGKLPVEFTLGTDVKKAKYAVLEGALNAAQIEAIVTAIIDGDQRGTKSVSESGIVDIELAETGVYTLVAVSFDADGAAQESASTELCYVAKGDEVPVVVNAGLTSTNKYAPLGHGSDNTLEFYIFGEEITDAKVALVKTKNYVADPEAIEEAVLDEESLDAETLAAINDEGYCDFFIKLAPGVEYTLVVWATNGYESKYITAAAKTTGHFEATIASVVGNYEASVVSYFNGPGTEHFSIAESDNADKGNLMFTLFTGIKCTTPIYATLDTESNKLIVPDSQVFATVSTYGGSVAFVNGNTSDPISFDVMDEGTWGDPSDIFGVYIIDGANADLFVDAYTAITAVRVESKAVSSAPKYLSPREGSFNNVSTLNVYRPSFIGGEYEPQSVEFDATESSMSRMEFKSQNLKRFQLK